MESLKTVKTYKDVFDHAESEYEFWENQMRNYGWDEDNAIAAGQFYGQMQAIAALAYIQHDDMSLLNRLNERRIRLYREDYDH